MIKDKHSSQGKFYVYKQKTFLFVFHVHFKIAYNY